MNKGLIFVSTIFLGSILAFLIAGAIWVWHIDKTWTPLIEPRLSERSQVGSVRVLAENAKGEKKWIGSLTAGRMEERQSLKLSDIPAPLVQAIIVLEDPRFLKHEGFDVWGILRAAAKNVLTLRYSQGGSTLTQQLVKNVFLSSKKTLRRKFTELVLSALVEKRFSKDEILEAYINEVYLGQLGSIEIHGVGRASEYYFGKNVTELNLSEMALLAALINSPGMYSPWKHPDKAKQRRDKVLRALADQQLILPEEYEAATKAPLPGPSNFLAPTRAAYMMDALRETLLQQKGEIEMLKGGFDVVTSLDLDLQELSEKVLLEASSSWAPELQGILVAADPKNCQIKAYAGGTSYRLTQLDRIRQSRRPIGSLMKPLETSPLLQNDDSLSLASVFDDAPLTWNYDKGRGSWSPENYDKKFRGKVTLRQTLEESLNVPLARVFYEREPTGLLTKLFDPLRAWGLEIPPERSLPSALLGAVDQTPHAVLQAYVKLTRQALGLASDAADLECALALEKKTEALQAVDPKGDHFGQFGSRLVLSALEGALRRGTSRALGAKLPTNQAWAGKTGTSSDTRDAWYVSISPDLVVLGWVGRDDNQITKLTGASGAMPLVAQLVEHWAKKDTYAAGWSWPTNEKLFWKPITFPERCRPSEIQQTLIKSAVPEPSPGFPPPEPFDYEGKKYIYEYFRSGAEPKECG